MSNFLPSDWPAFGAGSAFEARTGQPGDHRAERPSFGEFSPRRGEMPCVDDIHEPATECDMIGWPRIPSPIIRTEIRFVRSRPLARFVPVLDTMWLQFEDPATDPRSHEPSRSRHPVHSQPPT